MRIEQLTFFRFVAAAIVVVFHFGKDTTVARLFGRLATSGPQMVTFFFVLSGFVMTLAHYERRHERLRDYYVARIARIVPVYVLALGLMIWLTYSPDTHAPGTIVLSLAFLQSWFPPHALDLNDPAWSLSVEVAFYATFPFLLAYVRATNTKPRSFMCFALAFYAMTQLVLSNLMRPHFYQGFPSPSHDLIYYFPPSHYCSFLLGMAGAFVFLSRPTILRRGSMGAYALFTTGITTTYVALQHPGFFRRLAGIPLAFGSSFWGLLFLGLILCVAYGPNLITDLLSTRVPVLLGEASYALYILQKPLHIAYSKWIAPLLDIHGELHFYSYFMILLTASILSFYFVEKPAKRSVIWSYRKVETVTNRFVADFVQFVARRP